MVRIKAIHYLGLFMGCKQEQIGRREDVKKKILKSNTSRAMNDANILRLEASHIGHIIRGSDISDLERIYPRQTLVSHEIKEICMSNQAKDISLSLSEESKVESAEQVFWNFIKTIIQRTNIFCQQNQKRIQQNYEVPLGPLNLDCSYHLSNHKILLPQ